ncbi:protein MTSS 2 [Caerostris extrusa]|uniref:Protein MTSS 2 n=1 Tax=Caerostris extrusa TaxID=172846 RepID=A0AAV4XN14_CAEEX|nr:protein MTSS 2 [Caerostris extrusa]
MESFAEKECSALGGLFQYIINDLKVPKDIGSALTRLCLRHKSVEAKLKIFSSALVDHLVIPLQEKLEDWKKVAYQMDKDHAKAPKGDAKKTLDSAIRDVNSKYHLLEETEKQALRRALIEERSRYCLFVNCLRPVIESELSTMYEVTHIQEVLDSLAKLIEDPLGLPTASEQVILDVKSSETGWSFRTPPGSPYFSWFSKIQYMHGAFRLLSVSSQDSGFTSQDTLFTRLPTPPPMELTDQVNPTSKVVEDTIKDSPSYPDTPCAMSTWPNLQDTLQFEKAAASIAKSQRPHTISSAYERHNRPLLTTHTFRPLQADSDSQLSLSADGECPPELPPEDYADDCSEEATPTHKAYPPPLPLRAEEMDMSAPIIPPKTSSSIAAHKEIRFTSSL